MPLYTESTAVVNNRIHNLHVEIHSGPFVPALDLQQRGLSENIAH